MNQNQESQMLKPHGDKVLLEPIEAGEKTHGSIVIPDIGKEKPETGKVLAVGEGRLTEFGTYIEPEAQVGDIVLVQKVGTISFSYENKEYYLVQDKEILVTLDKENK